MTSIIFFTVLIIGILMVVFFLLRFCLKRVDDGKRGYIISPFKGVRELSAGKIVFLIPFFDQYYELEVKKYEIKFPRDVVDSSNSSNKINGLSENDDGLDEKMWRTADEFVRLRLKMIFNLNLNEIIKDECLRATFIHKSTEEIENYVYDITRPIIDSYLLTVKGHDVRHHPETWVEKLEALVKNELLKSGIEISYFKSYSHKKNDKLVHIEWERMQEEARKKAEAELSKAVVATQKAVNEAEIAMMESKLNLAKKRKDFAIEEMALEKDKKIAEQENALAMYTGKISLAKEEGNLQSVMAKNKKEIISIANESEEERINLEKSRLEAFTTAQQRLIEASGNAAGQLKPSSYHAFGGSGMDTLTLNSLKAVSAFRESGVLPAHIADSWENKLVGVNQTNVSMNPAFDSIESSINPATTAKKKDKLEITNFVVERFARSQNPNASLNEIENFQILDDDCDFIEDLISEAIKIKAVEGIDRMRAFVKAKIETRNA